MTDAPRPPSADERPLAVVTGATGAIGSATAARLVGSGWRVALLGQDAERLRAVAQGLGASATPVTADALTSTSVDDAFAEVVEGLGAPRALVHAVGSTLLRPTHAISDDEFAEVVTVNLTSAFYALRAFVRAVPRGTPAAALFFSTAATRIGLVNHDAISAAKGGVEGMVTAAAATYASRSIRVNALAPGLVRSALTRRLTQNPATLEASERMHPLGRVGEAEDVAALAAFLVGPEASWLTGQVIAVDGGLSGIKLPPPISSGGA